MANNLAVSEGGSMLKKLLWIIFTFISIGFIAEVLKHVGMQEIGQLYYLEGLIVSEIIHLGEKEGNANE